MYKVREEARSAAEAYKMHQSNITVKLAQLLELQRAHAQCAAKSPRNWGYAGDLGHLEEILDQAIGAVGGPTA